MAGEGKSTRTIARRGMLAIGRHDKLYCIFIIIKVGVHIVFNSTFCAESLLPGFANVAATIIGKTAVASQYT